MPISGAYTYTLDGSNKATITAYDVSVGGYTPTIPSTLDGYTVIAIGSSAFYNKGLTAVTFPSSITSIGDQAFIFNNISSITIPSTLTNLGSGSFAYNSNLTVILNSTITSTNSVFTNCSIGNKLTISSGVTSIPANLFNNSGVTAVTFPSSITSIGAQAFIFNNITTITLSSAVTSIGDGAFAYNSNLASFYVYNNSITLGNTVLTGNMSSGNKGTIYANDPSNTKTWWTNNWTGTYNFSTSLGSSPTVTSTSPATNITLSTVDVAGNVSSDGGATITERGFVYGTSINPTTANSKKVVSGTTGSYNDTITGLNESTIYHFRAYAINVAGTSYGADVEFTTASLTTTPTVTTTSPVTNITPTTVDVSGNVSSDGGATITERGFVYATTANPTTANNKVIVSGTTGAMSATLTGLSPNTVYHVRAYATNSEGTGYGDDVSWTSQIRQNAMIEILEYQESIEADIGTNASDIIYDGHGLVARDMIVNTTRRTTGAERGSRLVNDTGVTADTIRVETDITNQAAGDTILLLKYIDRTPLVKLDTVRLLRRSSGQSELSFTLVTDNQYVPRVGSYIRMNWNEEDTSTNIFKGILRSATRKMASEAESVDAIFLDCRVVGLNNVATRRTIAINESAGTSYGTIVSKMVTDYLYQDGITQGTIDTGELLAEDWVEDAISISDVLDQCASKSSYQWFVDDIGLLNFYQDPVSIPDATYTLEDGGTFTDYRDLTYEESIENYINKVFVVGGNDVRGNQIIVGAEEFGESTLLQETVGGTGVYGTIQRDGSVIESEYKTSEAGTTTTNIKITAHGQSIGDIIWNYTRNEYRSVTAVVDADNFTVDSVTSQTTGDIIALFDTVNKIIKNTFKVQSNFLPATFTFTTRELLGFNPGEKLYVDIARLRILTTYFAIEEVEIFHRGEWFARVKASLRDNSNFTTQRMPNYIDFFRGY